MPSPRASSGAASNDVYTKPSRRPHNGLKDQVNQAGSEDTQLPTILIAEDNDDLRSMLRQLLEANGYRVLEAVDGREAVSVAMTERPELVLMDLGLPGTDGLSAVTEIREHISAAEVLILIVSAYDRLEYRTEAISAGCSGYITKPIDPAALLKTINLLLGRGEGNEGASA